MSLLLFCCCYLLVALVAFAFIYRVIRADRVTPRREALIDSALLAIAWPSTICFVALLVLLIVWRSRP